MQHHRSGPIGHPLPDSDRARLQELFLRLGEPALLAATGISRMAFARALAGLGLRAGTVSLIQQGIRKLQEPSQPNG